MALGSAATLLHDDFSRAFRALECLAKYQGVEHNAPADSTSAIKGLIPLAVSARLD